MVIVVGPGGLPPRLLSLTSIVDSSLAEQGTVRTVTNSSVCSTYWARVRVIAVRKDWRATSAYRKHRDGAHGVCEIENEANKTKHFKEEIKQ